MAEQRQPVRRSVALKIIKPGMDTRQVIARFEAERQALALMDHPNIARVLDAGATDVGPTLLCDGTGQRRADHASTAMRTSCPPRDRLDLFVSVCQAVQHAHQKGIIHRDLKPTNVLVAAYDGKPVVKVIDFGVAKATGPAAYGADAVHGFRQHHRHARIHESRAGRIQRSRCRYAHRHLFSLGVLLYELLTGTTPLTNERLDQTRYDEMPRG